MAIDPAAPSSPADSDHDIHVKEWEKAREVLASFDNNLHDLRKYGFSFITAILAADGILLASKPGDSATAIQKVAVCGVTLFLILALHLIDRNYQVFQEAAATRALVLERKLNIELTEIISERYNIQHINFYVLVVYLFFIFGVLFIGLISLGAQFYYMGILLAFAVLATLFTLELHVDYKTESSEDWTISPLESALDGSIKITLTNFHDPMSSARAERWFDKKLIQGFKIPEPIIFPQGGVVWQIINEATGEAKPHKAESEIIVFDSRTWIVPGSEFKKPGVYQLQPSGWPIPLHRRIIISGAAKRQRRNK